MPSRRVHLALVHEVLPSSEAIALLDLLDEEEGLTVEECGEEVVERHGVLLHLLIVSGVHKGLRWRALSRLAKVPEAVADAHQIGLEAELPL
eukprot:15457842-Alexandrium_andersonii.AAC.1